MVQLVASLATLLACASSSLAASVASTYTNSTLSSSSLSGSRALAGNTPYDTRLAASDSVQKLRNGSDFLWIIQDTHDGTNFFDKYDFYTGPDPTHGYVNFVNASESFRRNLSYVDSNGIVVMKVDNTTYLPQGAYRDSVRVSSKAQYNTGLFILDLNHAPWGCSVWPAWWTLGGGTWPTTGEIDILEGVHESQVNQISFHTDNGCSLTNDPSAYTGEMGNAGCGYQPGCAFFERNNASYGPYFDSQGGGAFAMKWDQDGIAIWSFYRAAIPSDITRGSPTPDAWGVPSAYVSPKGCDPLKYFKDHSIIFDITFCGDWAGSSYANSGCPGSCADRLMDPANYMNASWSVNSVKVYKQIVLATLTSGSDVDRFRTPLFLVVLTVAVATAALLISI